MNKEYFTDNLSVEDMAEMIDKTLRFEKNAKNRSIKAQLLKMIPATAAFVLVIGLVNFMGNLNIYRFDGTASERIEPNNETEVNNDDAFMVIPDEDERENIWKSENGRRARDINLIESEVIMNILNTTPTGISFTLENFTDVEYTTWDEYYLFSTNGNPLQSEWTQLEWLIEGLWGYDIGEWGDWIERPSWSIGAFSGDNTGASRSKGYIVAPNSKTEEITLDWQEVYGEQPPGEYVLWLIFNSRPDDNVFIAYNMRGYFTID